MQTSYRLIRLLLAALFIGSLCACSGTPEAPATEMGAEPLPMTDYVTLSGHFGLQRPRDWENITGIDPRCPPVEVCWGSSDDLVFQLTDIIVGDIAPVADDTGRMTLAEYMDEVMPDMAGDLETFEIIRREETVTDSGLPAILLEVKLPHNVRNLDQWLVAEGQLLRTSYFAYEEDFDRVKPWAEATFRSVVVLKDTGE